MVQRSTCSESLGREILRGGKEVAGCTVDENVKPTEMLDGRREHPRCILLLADISLESNSLHTHMSITLQIGRAHV